ncbi:MAG: cytochrome c biogenesis protein ResB [Actinomycetota bacterium]
MTRIDSADPPEANPPVRRRRSRPGPLGFVLESVRMAWRWLTRMRTALYLLGVLGVETLVATVVPQEPNVPRTVTAWRAGTEGPGETVSAFIDMIGAYDAYGSPVFLATLLLLFTSLTACLLPRTRAWWRIARSSRPPRTNHLGKQEQVARFETTAEPEEALATGRALLGRRRWRLRSPDADPGAEPQVAAEKGHVLREGGSLLFHLSFYVLLIGVVLGQLLGFSGQVGIIEGDEHSWTETQVAYWSSAPGRWWSGDDHRRFEVTLDRFDVDWHRDPAFGGQPSLFLSHVTVTHPDGSSREDTVGGNDPLVVDGMKIHQLDWGYAPRVVIEEDGQVVHDGFLTLSATEEGVWHGAAKAPAADPDIGLDLFLVPYAPTDEAGRPQITGAPWDDAPLLLFRQYVGDLRLEAAQGVNTLDLAGLVEMGNGALRPGRSVDLGEGVTVSFPELRRWVGFQVSRRPTVPLLLAGAVLVLLGLVPALYASRRRLWMTATADPSTGRTTVTVAGRAFQRPQAFAAEYEDLVRALRRELPAPADPPGPSPASENRTSDPRPPREQVVRR